MRHGGGETQHEFLLAAADYLRRFFALWVLLTMAVVVVAAVGSGDFPDLGA